MATLPSYLRDPNEDEDPIFDDQGQLNPSVPPTPLNAGSPVPQQAAPPSAPGLPPMDPSRLSAAAQNYAKIAANPPEAPKPKWWQQLAGVGAAGLAGWSNAAGRTRNPIDIKSMTENIGGKPQYDKSLASWQRQLQGAQVGMEAERTGLDWASRIRKEASEEKLQSAQTGKAIAETETPENRRVAAQDKLDQTFDSSLVKQYGEDGMIVPLGSQIPDGFESTPLRSDPRQVLVHPPAFSPAPEDLVKGGFLKGYKVGQPTPYGKLKQAQDAQNKVIIEKNKNQKEGPLDQRYVDEYLQTHPGSKVADAVKQYKIDSQAPERPERPPQALMIGPDGRALVIRPGTQVPQGAQTPAGVNTVNTPTAQSRGMAEMAGTVIQKVPDLLAQIDALKSKLGPGAGRWNQLWINKAGFNDPDFAGLDQDLDLFASALVRTHFGGRGGMGYREALKKDFSQAQSPEDLKARIQHADSWLEGYAKMNEKKTIPGTPNTTGTKPDPLGIR